MVYSHKNGICTNTICAPDHTCIMASSLSVQKVFTTIDRDQLHTKNDVINHLMTFQEKAKVTLDNVTSINYNRLNHMDFKYTLVLGNPKHVKKKVFVRLWLGLLRNFKDIR